MPEKNTPSKKRYNLSNFESEFRQYLTAVIKLKPVTVKNYLSDIRFFAGWVQKNHDTHDIASISQATVQGYRAALLSDNLPTRTINRRLSALRKFFTFAREQAWVNSNPAKKVRNVTKSDFEEKQNRQPRHINPDIQLLFKSYKQDLTSENRSMKHIQAQLDDIHEFFEIINSNTHHASIS